METFLRASSSERSRHSFQMEVDGDKMRILSNVSSIWMIFKHSVEKRSHILRFDGLILWNKASSRMRMVCFIKSNLRENSYLFRKRHKFFDMTFEICMISSFGEKTFVSYV